MTAQEDSTGHLLALIAPYRDAPWDEAVRRRTELCLIDSLTCFSTGRSLEHFQPSVAAIARLFGHVQGETTPPAFVFAYLYGQAANSLDFDDTLHGHPGAPIVGAVLAAASRDRLPLDRILRGIAAGYEAHWLLAEAAWPSPERMSQVRSVGVWDTISAAIAVGVALDLPDLVISRTIGVAASHSLIPYTGKWYERPVPALKNNLGWAAAGGVMAVELALEGQSGITRPFDGENGMWIMAGSDRWDFDRAPVAKPAVLRTGFKQFPVCWHLQQFLKAASKAVSMLETGESITEVLLNGSQLYERFSVREIAAAADIAFSLPAAISLLISNVEPGPLWDSFDARSDELAHRNKVWYQESDSHSITVQTSSGRTIVLPVEQSSTVNLAPFGLDEPLVLAKHIRWTEAELQHALTDPAADDIFKAVPESLLDALGQAMTSGALVAPKKASG